jgi:hypothetical protein
MTEEWECLNCGTRVSAPVPRRPFNFHPPCENSGMGVLVPVSKATRASRVPRVGSVTPSEGAVGEGP